MRPVLPIQSTESHINVDEYRRRHGAMIAELATIGASVDFLNCTHDEIVFRCPPGQEDAVRQIHDKYFPR